MTPRGLVGLDIDGTILLQDETPSPGVLDAVAEVRAAGYEVMLATGRSWSGTRHVHEMLGLTSEYVVCSNGAVIMRRVDGEWQRWRVEVFDPNTVLELLGSHLPEANYMVELASGERLYTGRIDEWSPDSGRQVGFDELGAQPVSRVVVVSPQHDEADFERVVAAAGLNEVSYAIGWTSWLDIAPQGVDKGTALERVCAQLQAPRDSVLVAGDGRNDLGMFSWALAGGGRAVAMGQAVDEVQNAAGELTGMVEDGGLAVALRTLL
ncbi:HAD family phosphatase [Microbacterium esteraromaticum]|uniref:HAD-IIB family hydrolase n=1 Tax=Microbacterium esteraromaticum TaxID=57043 RepID=UPI001A908A1F|nr:HAD family phosphatase [Microbacterium esteraromaticum]